MPQVYLGHVGLHEAGGRHQTPRPAELDRREVKSQDPQAALGELAGRGHSRAAAQIDHHRPAGQQAGQFLDPSGVAADVLG